MFDKVIRHWWRVAGMAALLGGMWCVHEAWQVDHRWDERWAEWDRQWDAFEAKSKENSAALRQAENPVDQWVVALRIINLRRDQSDFQHQKLMEMQRLYEEKRLYWTLEIIFFGVAGLCPVVGMWLQRQLARRRARVAAAANDDDADDEAERWE